MYISKEDNELLERLFNGLDSSWAHDFMELLLLECSKKTGDDEWQINVREAKEIAEQTIAPNHMITKEMIEAAYRAVTERENEESF
jgi:hypothetical protein